MSSCLALVRGRLLPLLCVVAISYGCAYGYNPSDEEWAKEKPKKISPDQGIDLLNLASSKKSSESSADKPAVNIDDAEYQEYLEWKQWQEFKRYQEWKRRQEQQTSQ